MEKKIYNKLVRDKIPDVIKATGALPVTKILDDELYLEALNRKLEEETKEFLLSHETEELADIYEVLLAILYNRGISISEFEKIRCKKVREKGSFDEKIFLLSVEK